MGYICIICRESFATRCSDSDGKDQKTRKSILKTKENVVDFIVSTRCGHIHHYRCLNKWLSKCYENLKCPTCNQLIYTYELIQLFPANDYDDSDDNRNKDLMSSSKRIQEMLSLVEYLLKDLEQRDQMECQDERIGSLKAHVEVTEEAEKKNIPPNANANIIRPKGITIGPSSPNSLNTSSSLTKVEEAQCVQRVVEIIQRQKDEIEDLKTIHYKELRQELPNIHTEFKDLMRRVKILEKSSSSSGLLCSPVEVSSTEPYKTIAEDDDDDSQHKVAQDSFTNTLLRLGDKVVWKFRGQQQLGMVKWKGFVGSTIHAGVEFENPIRLPLIEEDLDCLFKSKPGHGYLVPVDQLINPADLILLNNFEFQNKPHRTSSVIGYMTRKIREIRLSIR